jgi:hypothetical protein
LKSYNYIYAAAALFVVGMVAPEARANDILFSFTPTTDTTTPNNSGNLGSSTQTYKDGGTGDNGGGAYLAAAYGFDCGPTSGSDAVCASGTGNPLPSNTNYNVTGDKPNLYGFSGGGLGLANNTNSGNVDEIPNVGFIQIDFSGVITSLLAAHDTIQNVTVNVTNINTGWNLFAGNTLGTLDGTGGSSFTAIGGNGYGTATQEVITGTQLASLEADKYLGISAAANCDVELSSIQINYTSGTGQGSAPEPATCVLMGFALVGMGLAGRKLRRRS